ncbi:hypothetical protein JGH11_05705 [Dysgonomonas sp. Marseille-P4677]|uniref:hypothetical protein n=1 Tax=Dysgonomonas sp. Marseille-P4677 TaxID=2364790 RepID=UPI0019131ACB|nr:hypothetical protein [Dysgonomonas sp. Marseille-P4677]MBK5720360.1 hypothetical protein [Dysgonomonas sp. Marseille-P4677]
MGQKMSKKKNTFYLSCYLKKSNALKTGEAPIYLRITVNKKIAAVSLQIKYNIKINRLNIG